MERLINEGKERYNKEIPKAEGQAQQLLQEAQGYAAEKVNRAKGDVARFTSVLQEYRFESGSNPKPAVHRNDGRCVWFRNGARGPY